MSATIDPELRRAVIEIVDERFRELEVRRSDFIGLKEVVERLASAQVGTEGALKELAAALRQKPFKIIADTIALGNFQNIYGHLSFDMASKIAQKYGYSAQKIS